MTKHNIAIERMNENDARLLIQAFIDSGWEYSNLWELGNHIFATFLWEKESEPIYPEGHQPQKN